MDGTRSLSPTTPNMQFGHRAAAASPPPSPPSDTASAVALLTLKDTASAMEPHSPQRIPNAERVRVVPNTDAVATGPLSPRPGRLLNSILMAINQADSNIFGPLVRVDCLSLQPTSWAKILRRVIQRGSPAFLKALLESRKINDEILQIALAEARSNNPPGRIDHYVVTIIERIRTDRIFWDRNRETSEEQANFAIELYNAGELSNLDHIEWLARDVGLNFDNTVLVFMLFYAARMGNTTFLNKFIFDRGNLENLPEKVLETCLEEAVGVYSDPPGEVQNKTEQPQVIELLLTKAKSKFPLNHLANLLPFAAEHNLRYSALRLAQILNEVTSLLGEVKVQFTNTWDQALQSAVDHGHTTVAAVLLKNHEFSETDSTLRTLNSAIEKGLVGLVSLLLKHITFDPRTLQRAFPFLKALQHPDIRNMLLIALGQYDEIEIRLTPDDNRATLHHALKVNSVRTLKVFYKHIVWNKISSELAGELHNIATTNNSIPAAEYLRKKLAFAFDKKSGPAASASYSTTRLSNTGPLERAWWDARTVYEAAKQFQALTPSLMTMAPTQPVDAAQMESGDSRTTLQRLVFDNCLNEADADPYRGIKIAVSFAEVDLLATFLKPEKPLPLSSAGWAEVLIAILEWDDPCAIKTLLDSRVLNDSILKLAEANFPRESTAYLQKRMQVLRYCMQPKPAKASLLPT